MIFCVSYEETDLYYLKSRYYNPKTGRFISKDNINYIEPMTVNGLNLYNYCFNNPITYIDPDGTFSIFGLVIGALIGAAVGFGITAYEDYKDDGKVFNGSIGWQTYLGATLVGGAGGGILGGYVLPALRHIPTGLKFLTDTAGFSHVVVTSTGTIVGGKALAGAGTLAALGGLTYMFSKSEPKMKNKPPFSWVNHQEGIDAMRKYNENAEKAAREIMNNHWNTWKKGAGTEYNAIHKWLDRIIRKIIEKIIL